MKGIKVVVRLVVWPFQKVVVYLFKWIAYTIKVIYRSLIQGLVIMILMTVLYVWVLKDMFGDTVTKVVVEWISPLPLPEGWIKWFS